MRQFFSKTELKASQLTGWAMLGILLFPVLTIADTVYAPLPPERRRGEAVEIYPESRFGQPAPRVNTGLDPSYVSRAVTEWDEGESRSPASSARRSPAVLVQEDSLGKSRYTPSVRSIELPEDRKSDFDRVVGRRKGVQEVALIAGDLGFFPKTVFVTRDVPVRMFVTGASRNALCIMMDSFQVRKQVRSQKIEEITFTPNQPGKYRFYCPVNGMEGTLIVKEFSSNETEASASNSTSPALEDSEDAPNQGARRLSSQYSHR